VVATARYSNRSYVETGRSALVTTVVPGRPPKAVLATAIVAMGIIVGVLALCFRFAFDQ